jgi:chemotaxis protein MotA
MDVATLIGVMGGFGLIGWAIMSKASILIFVDVGSIIIVIGGSIAAALTSFPLRNAMKIVSVIKKTILAKPGDPVKLITDLVGYAEIARRDGILSLENVTSELSDEFLKTGIQMAVDGTDPELIEQIMESEMESVEARHDKGKALMDNLKTYAPAFGMIGTLVGLVLMLQNMNDPAALGPGMAVALLTTLYGAVVANVVFGPLGEKLATRSAEEMFMKMIVVKGVMSIQSGDNPRIVEQKLKTFLPVSMRNQIGDEAPA